MELPLIGNRVESFALTQQKGVHPQADSSNNAYRVVIPRMLPRDTAGTSVMIVGDPIPDNSIAVRSAEVRGELAPDLSAAAGRRAFPPEVLGALLSGISVALMGFFFARSQYRRIIERLISRSVFDYRDETISWILGLVGIASAEQLVSRNERFTYAAAADILLLHAREVPEHKALCVAGLKGLLIVAMNRIAAPSVAIIRSNLAWLGEELSDADLAALRGHAGSDIMKLRTMVWEMFQKIDREG